VSANNYENSGLQSIRDPDNITKMICGGVTYEILEFFDGKKTLSEIITHRIINDIQSDKTIVANPSISTIETPLKG